jgi:phosphoglycolate phosphatase
LQTQLILFDIDLTLLSTQRAGAEAMRMAGVELYGDRFTTDGIEFAGNIDPAIVADMIRQMGDPPTSEAIGAFESRYARILSDVVGMDGRASTLPGVPEILEALEGEAGVVLGLLTGNFGSTGPIKLRAAGVDPGRFQISVWGDDSAHDPPRRTHLPVVAFDRYRERFGQRISPADVTIIGDTTHDIACALANGCRAMGVGTGYQSAASLREAGADIAFDDLSCTSEVLAWLLNRR